MEKLWLVMILVSVGFSPVVCTGLRVLGMAVHEMSPDSSQSWHYRTLFGDGSLTLQSDEHLILWGGGNKCWSVHKWWWGYCYFYMKVTRTVNREHYEILGGELDKRDLESKFNVETSTWGFTNKGTKVNGGTGVVWTGGWVNSWGYGYRSFYVNRTREPPMTKAFSYQFIKDSERWKKVPEVILPGSTDIRDASKVDIDEFDSWSDEFHDSTMMIRSIYRTPTTLIDFTAHMDRKVIVESNEDTPNEVLKERTIENNGCGSTYVVGSTGHLQDSLTVTTTESVSFTTTWSFGFSVSYTAGFDIKVVTNSLTISSEFSFSSEKSFTKSHTKTSNQTYKWPYVCNPGYKCSTTLLVTKKMYRIPCTMTFEREGEQFTRTNDMLAEVQTFHEIIQPPVPLDRSHC